MAGVLVLGLERGVEPGVGGRLLSAGCGRAAAEVVADGEHQ
jgi:hypothetical protein